MRRRSIVAGLFVFTVVLLAYRVTLGRYFTSEDFLLTRFLAEHPPWRDPELFTGPWLGVSVVKFYRPVSTLLYGLEIAAFGVAPFGYNVVHILVHVVNALLLFAIVRRLEPGTLVPAAAATLFALYPLHPNAVVFAASFATIVGAGFTFASFLAYQQYRRAGRRGWWAASIGLFVAALGSYEASAVLPALIAAYEATGPSRPERRRRDGAVAVLPFIGVLSLYFLLRRAVFGVLIGGYDDVGARLRDPAAWLADLLSSVYTLYVPAFERDPAFWERLSFVGFVTLVPLAGLAMARRRTDSRPLRLWLFAWLWILISQAPFAFRPCVPGNGRFWYVTAAGAAMSVGVVARGIGQAVPRRGRVVTVALVAGVALGWGWLLAGYLDVYLRAGRTVQTIQRELIRERDAAIAAPRIFVTRYPYFLLNAAGVPVAQVFHYGLRDAVNPPFVRASVPVYPLPPLRDAELRSISAADPDAVILAWDTPSRTFRRVSDPLHGGPTRELTVLAPAEGATLDREGLTIEIRHDDFRRFRVVVVAQGNGTIVEPTPASAPDGRVRLALPAAFVTTMARLYPDGEFFWWVDATDGSEDRTGFSRMRRFRLKQHGPGEVVSLSWAAWSVGPMRTTARSDSGPWRCRAGSRCNPR
jgi:hypothetical protein